MDKISIIVPAYNAEKYLSEAIESVLNQTYSNFELIIINDGSKDGTEEICKKYSEKDHRIKMISIPNGGVSNARNVGLKEVSGDYITFLDADDYIECDCLKTLIDEQKNNNVDALVYSYYKVFGNDKIEKKVRYTDETMLSGADIQRTFLTTDEIGWEIWGKLFKKELLDGVEFPTDRKIAEDAWFEYQVLAKCKSMKLIPYYGYFYRIIETSAMGQAYSKKNFEVLKTVEDIFKLSQDNLPEEANGFRLKYYIWFYRNCIQRMTKESKREFSKDLDNICATISSYKADAAKSYLSKKYYLEYLGISKFNLLYQKGIGLTGK